MPKRASRLRRAAAAAAALAIVSLSLPLLVLAPTERQAGAARAATVHPKKHKRSRAVHKESVGAAPNLSGCPSPYTNRFPPCQSTFPEGAPTYSGSTGAP